MVKSVYVREIITILKEPKLCPTCNKEDKLKKSDIIENNSNGKTLLCSRCEALIVITNHNLKEVDLSSPKDIMVMLKEPHLIRKVTY